VQVASWGAYLLSRNILTMSFAPRDTHEAQVQFALERGVPALIGILASKRLPYPSRAFDMAHCSRCLIPWAESGTYICIYLKSNLIISNKILCLIYSAVVESKRIFFLLGMEQEDNI
jgi:hypothetical protein